jgi:CRP/FNR family transcriptional regulator
MAFSLHDYLSRLAYFEGQDPRIVARIIDHASVQTAEAGETLFLEGEESVGLWIIESGRVKIYKLNTQGNEYILRICGERDTFNDISAFDGGTNPANAAALSDTRLWILPTAVFQSCIESDGQFALRVVRLLSGRVRGLVRQIENLTLYSVTARLARLLLNQMDDPALSGEGVTRAALAAHLATTPQTVSTALREIEAAGAIVFDRHHIRIVREDVLRSIAML